MSDRAEGDGWWLASDGKWYPPESRQEATEPAPTGFTQPTTNGMAVAAMVLGIIGAVTFGFFLIPSVLAVIFGHIALSNISKSDGRLGGRGMAIAGLVLGYLFLAWFVLFVVLVSAV